MSWTLAYPPDEQYTSLWNTDDPYLTVDRTTGRVFWVHATGDLRTAPLLVSNSPFPAGVPTAIAYAHGFQVYSTSDDGRTWKTADYSHDATGDWEKIFVGPPPAASSGAAQPSGYPNVVYMCANSPFEVSGPGRLCYKSLDGGATFSPAGYVYPSPSTPDACPALATNNAVVGRDGTIYHPVSCQNGAYLAMSRDEGSNYTWRQVPGAPPSSGLSGSLQVAIDDADALYALWTTSDHATLAISRDHGESWSAPLNVQSPGVHGITFPALAAGPRGHVGITYYASSDPAAKALSAYVTETANALDAQPLFYSDTLNDPAHPIFTNNGLTGGSPRADYVGGAYDASGTFWAGVVKQFAPPDANGNVPTTGYVGKLAFLPSDSAGLGLPAASPRTCVSRRRFQIRLRAPRGQRLRSARVYVNGRQVRLLTGRRLRSAVNLRGLPPGRFTVRIVARTRRGQRIVSVRRYRTCTPKRRAAG